MSLTKLIVIGFIIGFYILPIYAYDEESGLGSNESYSVEFNDGYNYYEWKNPEQPHWYDPLEKIIIKIIAFFTTNEKGTITNTVEKETWNGTGYESSGDKATFSWDLTHNANQTQTITTSFDPVEEYFKNNPSRIDNFTSIDDDPDHPDVLNVSTTINYNGTELDRSDYGYTTVTDDDLNDMKNSVGRQDYGFDISGMGGEGGLGDIYSSVSTGGSRSNGMSDTFKYLFYALIPLLFVLSVINMIDKIL